MNELTKEMALAILTALDAQHIKLVEGVEVGKEYAPSTVPFWEERVTHNRNAWRLIMSSNWLN